MQRVKGEGIETQIKCQDAVLHCTRADGHVLSILSLQKIHTHNTHKMLDIKGEIRERNQRPMLEIRYNRRERGFRLRFLDFPGKYR